jgi:hypothetical protein
MNQARFQKQQREKARREKAADKAARREQRRADHDEGSTAGVDVDEATLLAELAALHHDFAAGAIELEDFLAARAELSARLAVE